MRPVIPVGGGDALNENQGGGIVTLTTDFGWGDPYVGAMKGVIRSISETVIIEDAAHAIWLTHANELGEVMRAFIDEIDDG